MPPALSLVTVTASPLPVVMAIACLPAKAPPMTCVAMPEAEIKATLVVLLAVMAVFLPSVTLTRPLPPDSRIP